MSDDYLIKCGVNKPVDNFDKIREMLDFNSEDDFYFIQVLQRKKDRIKTKVSGSNNNSRLIKAYFVGSKEYFDFIKPEIIQLCEVFGARAGINLNKRSYKRMALLHLKKITDQILSDVHNKSHKAYSSVVGASHSDKDKKWILDIDMPFESFPYDDFPRYLRDLEPYGWKILDRIPSKNGFHYITKPFRLDQFKTQYPEIEVHKNNPTNLYIP